MLYRRLFILIEGSDDERFFKKIVKPLFKKRYPTIDFWKYSQKKPEKNKNFVKSINSMKADYICVTDLNNEPCVTARKDKIIINKFNRIITKDKIIVVVKEIEGWYLAGLDNNISKKLGIHKKFKDTNNITKEEFKDVMPKKFDLIRDFNVEILKYFSVEIAKQNNKSFKYFIEKHNC